MKLINKLSRRALLLACMLAGSSFLYAQSERIAFSGEEIPVLKENEAKQLNEFFKAYRLYQIDSRTLTSRIQGRDGEINLVLNLGEQYNWNLPIEINPLIDPNGVLRVMTEKGEEVLPPGEQITYQGSSFQGLQYDIRLTITDGLIYGYVTVDGKRLHIEPAKDLVEGIEQDIYIVYEPTDVNPNTAIKCGYIESQERAPEDEESQLRKDDPEGVLSVPAVCKYADLAYAADYSMVTKFGSVTAAKNHIVAVFNLVEPMYTSQLNVDFNLVQQYVSSCSTCDPWTSSTNPNTLLNSFSSWGPTGFTATHDLGSLWSNRDFDGSTVGLAWISALCGSLRYNINQDYTTSNATLQVLWAHEMGHNFGANHDASGTWVMNGTINVSNTTFSSTSVTAIESHMNNASCLMSCLTDLVVQNASATPPGGIAIGGVAFPVKATVKNIGFNTAGSSTIKFYLSTNTTWDGGDLFLAQYSTSSLSSGSSHSYAVNVTIPVGTKTGTRYVVFKADANSSVAEAYENNNTAASASFTVVGSAREGGSNVLTESSLDCYPNPVNDILTISYTSVPEETSLVIRNMQGVELVRKDLEENSGTADISMENIPSGVYFIYFMNKNELLKVEKIIRQ